MEKRVKTLAAVICMAALLIPVWQTTELKAAKQDKVTVIAKKKTKKVKKSKKKITYKGIVNIKFLGVIVLKKDVQIKTYLREECKKILIWITK